MSSLYMLVRDEWSLPLLLILLFALCMYLIIIKLTQQREGMKRVWLFVTGLALLYLTTGSPLYQLSQLSVSTHMLVMSIHYFVIPPILLLGVPGELYHRIRSLSICNRIVLPSKVALYLFAVFFFLYHFGFVLQLFFQYPLFHLIYSFILFYLAIRMWTPLLFFQGQHRLDRLVFRRYAFLSGLLLMPACSFLIISNIIENMNQLPFQVQFEAVLCITPDSSTTEWLPFPFHTKYDSLFGGMLMLGIHKIGLHVVSRKKIP